ncbi:DUF2156 domain-containing protein [Maribius pontilimi]|uniref:DUF2156 domain-containing protein n=1 Tax=Palleronia pontilimi TaxID=1964209 RepID=A0A934IBD3_9RHOB|nr:DUF2156 domain-containing protein [Palleronia pontilimi]MBJ3763974.1 DUF2156 domain-containing protein [Palleronia pontilimi]
MILSLGALWLARDTLAGLDPARALRGAAAAAPWQWIAALTATALTFAAYGRSEVAVHRWLTTGRDPVAARRTGMAALAIAQVTGLGPLVGMMVRWRCDLAGGLARAARVTALVSVSFLVCLGTIGAIAVLASGTGGPAFRPGAMVILGAVALFCAASVSLRHVPGLPPIRVLGALALWGTIDAAAACLAFWAFAPALPLFDLAPAFFAALGSGLVSALPGGLGSFDLCLLSLLPAGLWPALEGATWGFRLVHIALPAALAALALLGAPGLFDGRDRDLPSPAPCLDTTPLRAEAGLIHQPGARLLRANGRAAAPCWTASHALVALGAPFAGPLPLDPLARAAADTGRIALFYKISARQAAAARRAGWRAMRVGCEALVDPARFDRSAPACRQLRRKLRKAAASGVTIREVSAADMDGLGEIDAAWQAENGAARGVSMGRFDPRYLSHQKVLAACRDGQPVAFISLHVCAAEWTLDLVRWHPDAPDGTMHLLLSEAIVQARAQGIAQLSLAAVPRFDPSRAAGLHRFKSMFAPRWAPLYAAAPTRIGLWAGLADLARDIARPPKRAAPQDVYEGSEFAPTAVS